MSEGLKRRTEGLELPIRVSADGLIGLEIEPRFFSVDAVIRAAYKFTDRVHVFLQTDSVQPTRWLVVMRPKSSAEVADAIAGDFSNELIDQSLRERLEKQFGDVRTLIVAQAFSEGNLLDAQRDEGDYVADPLNIALER